MTLDRLGRTPEQVAEIREAARKKKIALAQRTEHAMSLRAAGLSYYAIGQELGVDKATAHRIVTRAMRRKLREPTVAVIEAEIAEIEELRERALAVLARAMTDPNTDRAVRVIETLIRLAESRRKLLGTDAPKRVNVTADEGVVTPVAGMTAEEFNAALRAGLERLRARADVVDVVPTTAREEFVSVDNPQISDGNSMTFDDLKVGGAQPIDSKAIAHAEKGYFQNLTAGIEQ